jgi:hypothetical protein
MMTALCIAPACGNRCCVCNSALTPEQVAQYAKRYAWMRDNPQWVGYDADYRPDQIDMAIDHAMTQTPNAEILDSCPG